MSGRAMDSMAGHHPKGQRPDDMLAQGNALGTIGQTVRALKGRHIVSPLQGSRSFVDRPRALPWAGMFCTFSAGGRAGAGSKVFSIFETCFWKISAKEVAA